MHFIFADQDFFILERVMADIKPVNGFIFLSAEDTAAAKKEAKAVAYLEERLKGRSPDEAKSMYEQILSQNLFHTSVGYSFLKELQDTLKSAGYNDLSPISVDNTIVKKSAAPPADAGSTKNPRLDKKLKSLQTQLATMRAVAIVCIIMVIAMFAITLTSKSPTVINYETKILDKYASWEEELNEREKAVSQRESELGITAPLQ